MSEKITLHSILTSSYAPTYDAFNRSKILQENLGFNTQNKVARLAIGRSLCQKCDFVLSKDVKTAGSSIKGNILFDSDYLLWISLIVTDIIENNNKLDIIPIDLFQRYVKIHWSNGIDLLFKDWEESGEDYNKFFEILSKRYAMLSEEQIDTIVADIPNREDYLYEGPIKFSLGNIYKTGDKFEYILNGSGYSPHVAIMGQAGSGKTRALLKVIYQIYSISRCPILLLDLGKGDLLDNKELISNINATPIDVPNESIPLDMFYGSKDNPSNFALEFRDALSEVINGNLGPKQKTNVYEATINEFRNLENITLNALSNSILSYYEENNIQHDSVTSTMHDLTIHNLFSPTFSPSLFFNKSWIISFANARDTDKTFALCLLLSSLNYYLKKCPESKITNSEFRQLRIILAIDEARTVLNLRHSALSENIRLHRSKGLSVFLSSQSPDDYDGKSDDYLENIGLPICFTTNATSSKVLKNMFNEDVNFSNLDKGVCLTLFNKKTVKVKTF